MRKIDLHFHTNNSDGFYSTAEILKLAEEIGLNIISITDHDSVQAYYDIQREKLTFNGEIIIGTELSFAKDGRLFDLLGYNFNLGKMNEWINAKYPKEAIFENQKNILSDMKALYKSLGIKFEDNIQISSGLKSEAYNLMKKSVMSFEENKENFPEFWQENFYKKHHTNIKSKFYVNEVRISPSLEEAIGAIKNSGGVCSLAHSGAYGFSKQEMEEFIDFAISCGVDGLELKYNCHTPEMEKLIKCKAKKNNLFLTGGSDFHGGRVKPNVKLGVVYGEKNIFEQEVEDFLNRVNSNA